MSETEESYYSADSSAEEVYHSTQSSGSETSNDENIIDKIQALLPHVSAVRVVEHGNSSSSDEEEEEVSSDSDDDRKSSSDESSSIITLSVRSDDSASSFSSCDESNDECSSTELGQFPQPTRVDTGSDCSSSSSSSEPEAVTTNRPKDIFYPEFQQVDPKTTKKRGRPPKKTSLWSVEKSIKRVVKLSEQAPSTNRNYFPSQEEVLAELVRLDAIRKQERAANRLTKKKKKQVPLLPVADVIPPVAATQVKSEGGTPDVPVIPMPPFVPTIEPNLVVPQVRRKVRGRPRIHFKDPNREKRKRGRPRTRFFDINRVKRPRGRPRKIKTEEDLVPKECKKRGRPPKPKSAEDLLPKIPKKRGRKPKGYWDVTDQNGVTPPKPKKPKLEYRYDSKKEVDQNKLLLMMNLGVRVVDINDPNACHVRRRGRPRKGEERPPPPPKGPPKKRGRKKKEVDPTEAERKLQAKAERKRAREQRRQEKRQRALQEKQARREQREMKRRERQELKSQQGKKKRGRRPREEFQFVEGEMQPPEQNIYINDAKALEKVKAKLKPASHVPAYKSRRLLSCCYCQQWSWDLLRCTNCLRSHEYNTRTVCVEEHEVITEALDKSRPFFHPPPVPYYRPGRVVFCTGCFYYSSDMKNCSECEAPIPEYSQVVLIDFENSPECLEKPGTFFATFKPRAVDDRLLECPYCELTLLRSARHCPHCKRWLPRQISIVPDLESGGPPEWPTPQMLKQGAVTEMPDSYEPIFREKTVTMCRWCCTVVWDLNRCTSCFRKLPATSDLMEDGPTYDFAEGKQAERPIFDPKPFPYLRPGVSVACPECGEYSKDKKNCDNCGKRLTNRSYVKVCFKQVSKPPAGSQVLPFVARRVNVAFMLCPHCEFSYIRQKNHCAHCHKRNPNTITIVPYSMEVDKPCTEQTFNKLNSIFHCQTLAILGADDKKQEDLRQQQKPRLSHSAHYVPRYRERGVAQCLACLGWTWDMDRCSLCFVPMMVNIRKPPLIIYPKPGAIKDVVIEKLRPKFAKTPLPYLRPGRLTLCQCCGCYTQGPPFCTECGKLIAQHPVYVNIDFSGQYAKVPPGCRKLPYQPRVTMDGELALCPFCGYTTENFSLCSFCQQEIPSYVLLIPENPDIDSFQVLDELLEKKQPKATVLALKPVPPPKELPQNIIKLPPPVKISGVEMPVFIMPPGVDSTLKPPPAKVPKPTNQNIGGLGAFNFVSHVDSKTLKLHQVLAAKNLISTKNAPTSTITSAEASGIVTPKSMEIASGFDSAVASTSGTCSPDLTNVATSYSTFKPDLSNVAATSGSFKPDLTNEAATSGSFKPDLTNVATTYGTFEPDLTNVATTYGTLKPDIATNNVPATSGTLKPDIATASNNFWYLLPVNATTSHSETSISGTDGASVQPH
ncbi:hypothetical protein B566_EDAN012554 [Ephemera danica]|nr:hypothetical protein B566_EDAN012554 [Ephemera danica]